MGISFRPGPRADIFIGSAMDIIKTKANISSIDAELTLTIISTSSGSRKAFMISTKKSRKKEYCTPGSL